MSSDKLDEVLEITNFLARKAFAGDYIFRGEPECYEKVSSRLYRDYEEVATPTFDIEVVQREILDEAKGYTNEFQEHPEEIRDFAILTQLQHYGGKTNLIDFTTDYLIALYFACDGAPDSDGRVVLLSELGEMAPNIWKPHTPANRVAAQKSIFLRPPLGFVEIDPDDLVTIPSTLKQPVLGYLRSCHGISTKTIYNDLHGFIRQQTVHQSAYTEFFVGSTLANTGDYENAIDHYTNAVKFNPQTAIIYHNRGTLYYRQENYELAVQDLNLAIELDPEFGEAYNNRGLVHEMVGDFDSAIRDYNRAVELNPEDADAYCNLGQALLHLARWDEAKAELMIAVDLGADIEGSFHEQYENVADFEQQTGLTLPDDMAEMLGG